jgi:hypothetical protein
MEAEYRALSDATRETVWISTLLEDLGMANPSSITIFYDNESCIKLASDPVFHSKTKHIRTHYHFTREKVAEGEISVQYISSLDQTADLFTKPLIRI